MQSFLETQIPTFPVLMELKVYNLGNAKHLTPS